MKCLGISVTKYVDNLYEETIKLKNKINEEINKWREIPYSWIEDSILPRCQSLPI